MVINCIYYQEFLIILKEGKINEKNNKKSEMFGIDCYIIF